MFSELTSNDPRLSLGASDAWNKQEGDTLEENFLPSVSSVRFQTAKTLSFQAGAVRASPLSVECSRKEAIGSIPDPSRARKASTASI